MNRKLLSLLVALVAMFGCLGSVQAQEYVWDGEVVYANGNYYFYNVAAQKFIQAGTTTLVDASQAGLFTLESSGNGFMLKNSNGKYLRWANKDWFVNWKWESAALDPNGDTGLPIAFKLGSDGSYKILYDGAGDVYLYFDSSNGITKGQTKNSYNSTKGDWLMISNPQMDDELSRQEKIKGYQLAPYTGENGKWNDVSGYIKNANVYQSYSDKSKIPFGWTAYKHESGNGTYSLETGDTKLECWHGEAAKFDVDYYQTVKLPQGKYRLSADVLFRGTENTIALYVYQSGVGDKTTLVNVSGETYNKYYLEFDVAENNTEFNIGVKKVGTNTADNAWMAADNFKLEYWTEDAPVVELNSNETAWVMSGTWLASDMTNLSTKISANPKLLLDASGATLVGKPTIPVPTAVPNMMIKVANAGDVANTQNVIANGECANFVLTDKKDFAPLENFKAKKISYTRSNTAGYNTVCMPFDVKASDLAGTCTAYKYASIEEDVVNFEEKGADVTISAGTPILVEDTGSEWTVKISENRNVVANAGSEGIVEGAFIKRTLGEGFYKLNSAGTEFVHSTSSSTITPFRFFANGGSSSEVKSFVVKFVKASEETAIKGLQQETATDGVVYDLMGRKVAGAVRPGIYIKGGKKVMIK